MRHLDLPTGSFYGIGQNCIIIPFKSSCWLMPIKWESTLRENIKSRLTIRNTERQWTAQEGHVLPQILDWSLLYNDINADLVGNCNNVSDILQAWKWAVRLLKWIWPWNTFFHIPYTVITDIFHHMNPLIEWNYNKICLYIKPR